MNYTEYKKHKKRTIIGWVAAALAVAVLFTAMALGLFYMARANRNSKLALDNVYQRNLYDMSESLSNVESNMSKLLVSNSGVESAVLLNDTYRQSQSAINSLCTLPISQEEKIACAKFLNQLGDWCDTYAKKMADEDVEAVASITNDGSNAHKSDSYEAQLESLYTRAVRLHENVRDSALKIDGKFEMSGNITSGVTEFRPKSSGGGKDNLTNDSAEFPELIYDGPFSDSRSKKSFKGLEGKEELTQEQAANKAKEIFRDMGLRSLEFTGESKEPDAYSFRGITNSDELHVSISKQGGIVLTAIAPYRDSVKTNAQRDAQKGEGFAKEKALEYAKICGYDKLTAVWYNEIDGYAVVNLAPETDGIIHYPDLVKVKLKLDDGALLGIEATGYCKCNHKRDGLKASIDKDEAQKSVNKKLNVYAGRLALIPKDNKEILCYEFACEYRGLDYFVYIDAKTGRQVNILRVMDADQGKMVI